MRRVLTKVLTTTNSLSSQDSSLLSVKLVKGNFFFPYLLKILEVLAHALEGPFARSWRVLCALLKVLCVLLEVFLHALEGPCVRSCGMR